ncbi:MAG: thymidylate synthase [Mucilaginibacter sp.]|jgi:thymidylate synthase|uniref:thymidylate synthase n=1 Tax=Mucilaginibacter sp. TaxID=1882438 RepID=UPI00356476FB
MRSFNTVQTAYTTSLKEVLNHGKLVKSVKDKNSVGSYFGSKDRDFIEILGYSFILNNPLNRLIFSRNRKLSLGFGIANFIWLISGRKDVATISFYNRFGSAYSSDGTYYEAAFGNRIFGHLNLWNDAKQLLNMDINSRRALLPIFIPSDLKDLPNDTPCASSIQLMIRGGKLEFFLHMRSQSAAMVFPYDIFLFTMLHEFFSQQLNIPIGRFHYYCNSFHYYKEEEELVKRIVKEGFYNKSMPSMDSTTFEVINDLIQIERQMRESFNGESAFDIDSLKKLPEYWAELFRVVYHKACIDHGCNTPECESRYLKLRNTYL